MSTGKKQTDIQALKSAIRARWTIAPSGKARHYVGKFFDLVRIGRKITAKVEGNHGTYTVSIELKLNKAESACSCYIGKEGFCHHCVALAFTFLQDAESFREIISKTLNRINTTDDVKSYLKGSTLDSLMKGLKEKGITQKEFSEMIGMNP